MKITQYTIIAHIFYIFLLGFFFVFLIFIDFYTCDTSYFPDTRVCNEHTKEFMMGAHCGRTELTV